jgi:hypothetical protein
MRLKTPKSTEEVLNKSETVDSAPNHGGAVTEAQPTVDGGIDSGVGSWSGDGPFKIRFEKA